MVGITCSLHTAQGNEEISTSEIDPDFDPDGNDLDEDYSPPDSLMTETQDDGMEGEGDKGVAQTGGAVGEDDEDDLDPEMLTKRKAKTQFFRIRFRRRRRKRKRKMKNRNSKKPGSFLGRLFNGGQSNQQRECHQTCSLVKQCSYYGCGGATKTCLTEYCFPKSSAFQDMRMNPQRGSWRHNYFRKYRRRRG